MKMKASLSMMRAASLQCSNGLRYGRGHLWILELSKACSAGRQADRPSSKEKIETNNYKCFYITGKFLMSTFL